MAGRDGRYMVAARMPLANRMVSRRTSPAGGADCSAGEGGTVSSGRSDSDLYRHLGIMDRLAWLHPEYIYDRKSISTILAVRRRAACRGVTDCHVGENRLQPCPLPD